MQMPSSRLWRNKRFAQTIALTALLGSHTPRVSAGEPDTVNQGLRMLTYNTAFVSVDVELPPPVPTIRIDVNDGVFSGLNYKERAYKIADRILQTDNDVVVLNEVFSDEAEQILVDELRTKYPSFIRRIAATTEEILTVQDILGMLVTNDWDDTSQGADLLPGQVAPGNSGLMIFSRFPFIPFTSGTNPMYDVKEVDGENNLQFWGLPGEISTAHYTDCVADDCFASKGISMVRIKGPAGPFSVAFTHMNADYLPKVVADSARKSQLELVRELITSSLTANELITQPIFFMGDLNVPGDLDDGGSAPGTDEWETLFHPQLNPGGFFACGDLPCTFDPNSLKGSLMTDSWGFETSPDDNGLSNYNDGARLDYIFHNKPTRQTLCMQHAMIAYDLGDHNGIEQFSDHMGVRADFNRPAPQCSPNEEAGTFGPKKITFGQSPDFTWGPNNGAQLAFPGSMQWYRIDNIGTYSFTVTNSKMGFDVYQGRNLSAPFASFEEDPQRRGTKFILTDPPYFVRVYGKNAQTGAPDRNVTGTYSLLAHEYRGKSPDDALGLPPGYEYQYQWPASNNGTVIAPDQLIWFEFYTDVSTGGLFPDVSFLQELTPQTYQPKVFTVSLAQDDPAHTIIPTSVETDMGGSAPFDFDDDGWHDQKVVAPPLPGSGTGPKRYFVRITRDPQLAEVALTSVLEFNTNLTYFFSYHMHVSEEMTWGPADDEVTSQWLYDEDGPLDCKNGVVCGYVELNDNSEWYPSDDMYHHSFVKKLTPSLWDDYNDDPTYFMPQWYQQYGDSERIIPALFSGAEGVWEEAFVWSDTTDPNKKEDDADYWYTLQYWESHDLNQIKAHKPGM